MDSSGNGTMESVTPGNLEVAYVDVVDACQLKCPTCVRGLRVMENSPSKISLDKFAAVIDKFKAEGYKRVGLYSWTEPFLARNLQDYVAEVKKRGMPCLLSTTFSLRHIDNLEATLLARPDHIYISISGMDQEMYEINHASGNLSYALSNLGKAADIVRRHGLPTTLMLRFIRFDYNASHVEKAHACANDLGIMFEVIEGGDHPQRRDSANLTNQFYVDRMAASKPHDSPEARGQICPLMFEQLSVDSKGDVYTCCAVPTHPSVRIGSYLDMSADEILLRRWTHPYCRACEMPRREATASDRERIYRAASLEAGLSRRI
jgi:pyruvate-formate lyase-activating enzyme